MLQNKNVKNGVSNNETPLSSLELELLKTFGEDGILALQRIQSEIQMKKRQKILDDHPYKPTYNEKKGRWYTRFESNGKLIQKNRKTLQEIEDCIVEFYSEHKEEEPQIQSAYTFTAAHDKWLESQKEYGKTNNSIRRYETDWNRFFADNDFRKKDIREITSRDIEIFMINAIKKFNLKHRGSDGLYACISGVFYNAVMDRIIKPDENPCTFVDKKKFARFYNTDGKTPEERTVSSEELTLLINQLSADINRRPSYIYPYGVQLSILTGMRVGEIAGLRWKHINNGLIKVCESEKYDVVERKYYQDTTKTGKIRYIPITDQIQEFLDKMKRLQSEYGIVEDFVLSFSDGKIRCKNLTAYMNHKCEQLQFDSHKSIHAIRRTFNSHLRYNGVSATEAGSLIGNTPRVNDEHYTYDIQSAETKRKYMTDAETRMTPAPLV